jgi:hypothetical protein
VTVVDVVEGVIFTVAGLLIVFSLAVSNRPARPSLDSLLDLETPDSTNDRGGTNMTKIPFPEEAWPKFKKALQYIAEEPRRLNMSSWIVDVDRVFAEDSSWNHVGYELRERDADELPPCGTAVCLGGAVLVANGVVDPKQITYDQQTSVDWGDVALATLGFEKEEKHVSADFVYSTWAGVAAALNGVFEMTWLDTYDELADALETRFTFPEPLPRPSQS